MSSSYVKRYNVNVTLLQTIIFKEFFADRCNNILPDHLYKYSKLKFTKEYFIGVVYNRCYGGFGIPRDIKIRILELGYNCVGKSDYEIDRHNPAFVQAVYEQLSQGNKVRCSCSDLSIHELKGNKYIIDEYDGFESILESNNRWIYV